MALRWDPRSQSGEILGERVCEGFSQSLLLACCWPWITRGGQG